MSKENRHIYADVDKPAEIYDFNMGSEVPHIVSREIFTDVIASAIEAEVFSKLKDIYISTSTSGFGSKLVPNSHLRSSRDFLAGIQRAMSILGDDNATYIIEQYKKQAIVSGIKVFSKALK